MRIFVSEFVCSGTWNNGPLDGSLANEGRSMLLAACADFAKIPDVRVITTWDARLGIFPLTEVQAIRCSSPEQEREQFERLSRESDAVYVIAPEFETLLTDRRRRLDALGANSLNSTHEAIELCGDKLRLAEHLIGMGASTIETSLVDWTALHQSACYPIVVKPRCGAGSLHTFLVRKREELDDVQGLYESLPAEWKPIVQPFIAGRTLSVGALVDSESGCIEIFPPAEQFLSSDGRFHYLGGRIQGTASHSGPNRDTIRSVCKSIPGLRGYVGFDILFPSDEPEKMKIVEINPRLTTSYLGYRVLTAENIMERMLAPRTNRSPLQWMDRAARFTPVGKVTFEDC